MKLFEIKTLGCTYLFKTGEDDPLSDTPPGTVRVRFSQECDFELSYSLANEYYLPDLSRGFAVFLKYALGYPAAEYDVRTPCGIIRASVPLKNFLTEISLVGSTVSELKIGGLEAAYRVSVAGSEYAVILCSDSRGADLRQLRHSILAEERSNSVRALIAVSGEVGEYTLGCLAFTPELTGADSRSLASVVRLLSALGRMGERARFTFDGGGSVCTHAVDSRVIVSSDDARAVRVLL